MLRKGCPGEADRDAAALERVLRVEIGGRPRSSAEDRLGDDNAGEGDMSSISETCPLSSDAAKLLEISGSDTKAYDECVEAVEVVEVVRPRADTRDARGSSCQTELVVSTLLYNRPLHNL
jgi:hypothetical protein